MEVESKREKKRETGKRQRERRKGMRDKDHEVLVLKFFLQRYF